MTILHKTNVMILGMLCLVAAGCTGTITDERDGTTYTTVRLGSQTWLAENANYETDNTSWCYDDDPANCETYGRLYSWDGARSACPAGWHLATDQDWITLARFLDPKADPDDDFVISQRAGGMMKATGTLEDGTGLWNSPNAGATNISRFSALPGGTRSASGGYRMLGAHTMFWTADEYDATHAWTMMLDSQQTGIFRDNNMGTTLTKAYGLSVRCVKD
jgi:uncharacterized protein (TIGR02145 family)